MNEENGSSKIITPSAEEVEAMKKMAHSATLSLAIVLGQMWAEHKRVDAEERPVEFAISLRGMAKEGEKEPVAMFRAEAMWLQKVNGDDKVFHAHGPAFGATQLNEGVNITAMFRALGEGVAAQQKKIEEQAGLRP